MDAEFWDELYNETDRRWSGDANGTLVEEVEGLPPGRALDVGCGEGGDAIWLARQGWQVTGTELSQVALERARHAGAEAGVAVRWVLADLQDTPPEARAYDLVSLQYVPLLRARGPQAVRGLIDAVAPGGTLLVVSHDLSEVPEDWHGPDPAEFYDPAEVAELLDDAWQVDVQESRARRHVPHGNPHINDVVLRARRVS